MHIYPVHISYLISHIATATVRSDCRRLLAANVHRPFGLPLTTIFGRKSDLGNLMQNT